MIYTLTLNPALDYVLRTPDYREGAVNRAQETYLLPGGKGINVSLVLGALRVDSVALGFTAGFTGLELARRLEAAGCRTDFIQLPQGMTRINVKLKGAQETEVNAPGPAPGPEALEQLLNRLDALKPGDTLVLAGSVPAGVPSGIYRDILARLDGRELRVVVDAEKDLLRAVLPYHPFLIKPNHLELGALFDQEIRTPREAALRGLELREMGARNVLVSMAGQGAVLVPQEGPALYAPAPAGKVINSTGAGDSMIAGFLAGLQRGGDSQAALTLGLCAGSATAFSQDLATGPEIEALAAALTRAGSLTPLAL